MTKVSFSSIKSEKEVELSDKKIGSLQYFKNPVNFQFFL